MITIQRTGQRPLTFDGTLLAEADSQSHDGPLQNRWHEAAVYQTTGGKYVVQICYRTKWQGEHDHDDALAFATKEEAATLLEEYIFPNLGTIGYPAHGSYQDKQARLLAELDAAWKLLVTHLLTSIGATENVA